MSIYEGFAAYYDVEKGTNHMAKVRIIKYILALLGFLSSSVLFFCTFLRITKVRMASKNDKNTHFLRSISRTTGTIFVTILLQSAIAAV